MVSGSRKQFIDEGIAGIAALFDRLGGRMYSGEPVTQLEHALQSAALAQQEGAAEPLVVAALLHDIGHLVNDRGETPTARGVDDLHQFHGARFLRKLFGPAVTEPIRLHVEAKRYLCATRSGYYEALSEDSRRSLVLQGGVFTAEQAQAFAGKPYAEDAARLRIWDDQAKVTGQATPGLADFLPLIRRCAQAIR
jgi:phosphonate degradation associated HDIG domain protein